MMHMQRTRTFCCSPVTDEQKETEKDFQKMHNSNGKWTVSMSHCNVLDQSQNSKERLAKNNRPNLPIHCDGEENEDFICHQCGGHFFLQHQ